MIQRVPIICWFCSCLVIASCRDSTTKRMRAGVWEPNPYVPTSQVGADFAHLDLETVCLLRFQNNDIGYIRFIKADKWHAQYESAILLITEKHICGLRSAVTNGLVQLGRDTPTVLCGDISVRWLPPTTIFFSDEMSHAALVSLKSFVSRKFVITNEVYWSPVDISPL